jgi:putative hydrolase of the HAD superfamily
VALGPIEAVLFDMGGTLVDYPLPSSPAMVARCLNGAIAFLVRPEEELPLRAASIPGPEAVRHRRRPGADTPVAHRAMTGLRRIIRSVSGRTLPQMAEACVRPVLARGRLYDDALPTLQALKSRGYRLGLVSNTPWGTPDYLWQQQAERFGVASFLEVRLFSSDVGVRKPDPRIFLEALRGLGARPERALFVGDTPHEDVAGAKAVGMTAALLARGPVPPTAAQHPGDFRIARLTELLDRLPGR